MATLPAIDRIKITKGLMRYWSREQESVSNLSPTNLFSAITAVDQWVNDNTVSYNNALPEPFQSNATLAQKTLLLVVVAAMRVGQGFLIRLIGGEIH